MRHAAQPWMALWGMVPMLIGLSCGPPSRAATPTADTASSDIVSGVWQHHKAGFDYVGFTSLYTCDGLESHVLEILRHLGARKDIHVSASGCPGPYNTPSRTARVDADFYTVAPIPDASAPDAVKARWTALEVTPRRPGFMGDGDCELIQAMKDLITTKNFTLRNLEYRTDCVPHELTLDAFAVKGQVLKAVPSVPAAPAQPVP